MQVNFLKFKHCRDDDYKTTADNIYNLINEFSDREDLEKFYTYFKSKYNLPKFVIKQTLKQYLAKSYLLKSAKFKKNF